MTLSKTSCSTSRVGRTSGLFLPLAFEEFQVMQNFAQHRFGLVFDFFEPVFRVAASR